MVSLTDERHLTLFTAGTIVRDLHHFQCDGVSMVCSLAPVLANIILTEFEKVVVTSLMESGILKFYCRSDLRF